MLSDPYSRPILLAGAATLIVFPMHGCGILYYLWHTDSRHAAREAHTAATRQTITLGRSVEGRPVRADVFGQGTDCTLIIATIHGNEWAGTPLLQRLADHLPHIPEVLQDRRVVLIPVANPDGYHRRSRHNRRRVDLNRNFPAHNRKDRRLYGPQALSEPEARAIDAAIRRFRPDRIISIHQPAACVDYDGPAEELARAIAEAGRLKVKRLGSRPGSLGAYAGETIGIPVVTLELPRRASRMDADDLWERFGPPLMVGIEYAAK